MVFEPSKGLKNFPPFDHGHQTSWTCFLCTAQYELSIAIIISPYQVSRHFLRDFRWSVTPKTTPKHSKTPQAWSKGLELWPGAEASRNIMIYTLYKFYNPGAVYVSRKLHEGPSNPQDRRVKVVCIKTAPLTSELRAPEQLQIIAGRERSPLMSLCYWVVSCFSCFFWAGFSGFLVIFGCVFCWFCEVLVIFWYP